MPEPISSPREGQPAEHLEHLELGAETNGERVVVEHQVSTPAVAEPATPTVVPVQPVAAPTPRQTAMTHHVERILADGLDDAWRQLDQPTQERFKHVGEETAVAIASLLQGVKVQTKKIIDLIVAWLKIIPGVNRFFLEQEAKIKADRLLALRQRPPAP